MSNPPVHAHKSFRHRFAWLVPTGCAAVMLFGVAPASAYVRQNTAKDLIADSCSYPCQKSDPAHDIVSTDLAYDSSGTVAVSVQMAGPIEGNLGIVLYLSTHDDQGNCKPPDQPDSLYVRVSTIPDTPSSSRSMAALGADHSSINAPTRTVDGDRITVTLTDSRIANNDYVCADINSSYENPTNHLPVDDAPNYVDGFGPTNAEGLIQAMLPTGKAGRIGNILDAESYVTDMTPRSPGSLSIVWSSLPTKAHPKPVVIAKGSGMIIGMAGSVKVRLTSRGRNILLDAGHSLKMSVKGTYNPTEGATVTRTKDVTLRR